MTGSTATGKKIMSACAADLKRLVLELGGKDPMVVFADADLDTAVEHAVDFSIGNAGQVCCSVERIYVAEALADAFVARAAERVRATKAGDGSDPSSTLGPMVSKMQRDAVAAQVDDAVKRGARLVCRGAAPDDSAGNWYPATLLADVPHDAPISRDETFGPVVAVTRFDGSEAEAVRLANDTSYGLAAYVYTKDVEKGARVAMQIKAGQVGINNYSCANAPSSCPWIGLKGSGLGSHSGPDGWRAFSNPKSLIFTSVEERSRGAPGPLEAKTHTDAHL